MQKQMRYHSFLFLLIIFFLGCSNNETAKNTGDNNNWDKPNTDYKPAFDGQHRIKRVVTNTAYKVDSIAEKIGRPWGIIALPDGNLLITDRTGFMQIRKTDGSLVKKISGFPKVNDAGQGGMLDVALDPNFAKNKTIYWAFAQENEKGNLTAVAKGQLVDNDTLIKNPTVIFRATPELTSTYHYGGRLLFDKEGYLFVSVGEKSELYGRKQAQWLSSGLGKVFKITTDGKAAPGNPFAKQQGAMAEIYSYGHRNPQGLATNPVTGDIWEVEFGPRGGDELNIIKPGKNYGWPTITYGIEYDSTKIGAAIQQKEGMEQPVYYWDPVVSPSGILFYESDAIPEWKNNLFISGLSSTQIIRLVIENNKVVGEESLLKDKKQRIRDITQLNGVIYAITDSGIMYSISKK
jgi:aldose sugar dehydrogenase